MAAPQDVHVRICNQEIVKFDLEVKALIQDIRDCSGPLSALTELNTKVKEKFQHLRRRIQELEQSAKEQDKESEKQILLQEVENHKKQMLSNQTSWRKANLTCKIAIDNLEKAELLQGGDLLRQRKTTKESLAQTSSAITESLMGISRMMSQQVQQSEEAMQTLDPFQNRPVCVLQLHSVLGTQDRRMRFHQPRGAHSLLETELELDSYPRRW
ncbi:vesicle transport protein SEC20 isoform X3 [Ailuropoda melanoleuca]|uniref:BCL2 interacting protein 1 n=1 Tax=Ailuropoda melanoleuca TaxID=9646 RepID=G1LXU0_AILME|nr:vesicle transport protein SEC20 isoform X3 [Ailuropoda melanoleuca]